LSRDFLNVWGTLSFYSAHAKRTPRGKTTAATNHIMCRTLSAPPNVLRHSQKIAEFADVVIYIIRLIML